MTTTTLKKKTLTELVELGYIAGVFGVRGEVRLHLHNRDTSLLDAPLKVLLQKQGQQRSVTLFPRSAAGGKVIARVEGVTDRNEAETLKGFTFSVPASVLPALEEGEYFLSEVVGMQVFEADRFVGTVVAVHTTGPVEVLELDGDRYLPSTRDRLLLVDREAGRIVIAEGSLAV